jgi:hypothetical protein
MGTMGIKIQIVHVLCEDLNFKHNNRLLVQATKPQIHIQ